MKVLLGFLLGMVVFYILDVFDIFLENLWIKKEEMKDERI